MASFCHRFNFFHLSRSRAFCHCFDFFHLCCVVRFHFFHFCCMASRSRAFYHMALHPP
ncbi:hypothetical protein ACJX0J_013511, partial [Zea mays]